MSYGDDLLAIYTVFRKDSDFRSPEAVARQISKIVFVDGVSLLFFNGQLGRFGPLGRFEPVAK